MALQSLQSLGFGSSEEFCLCAVSEDIENDIHPAPRALFHFGAELCLFLPLFDDSVDFLCFPAVNAFVVLDSAQCFGALENEAGDVDGENGWRIVQTARVGEGLVGHGDGDRNGAELGGGVDVDEAVLAHDEDGEPRRPDVLLCPGEDDCVFCEVGDGPRHERGGVVGDEREQGVLWQEMEGERRGGRIVVRELDAVDGLVLAVVDEGGIGGEGVRVVGGDVVKGLGVFRVVAGVGGNVDRRAAGHSPGLFRCLFAPGAGHGIVHDPLIMIGIKQVMTGEHIEDDSGELAGAASLCKEDGMGRRHTKLGADEMFEFSDESSKLFRSMGDFSNAYAGPVKVKQALCGFFKH